MARRPKTSPVSLEDIGPPPAYEEIEHIAGPSSDPPTTPASLIPLEVVEARPRPPLCVRLLSRLVTISSYTILPLSIIIGCAITACTTYALVRHVEHLVATAHVGGDKQEWAGKARTDFYEKCYFGCGNVEDPACTYTACARTARVQVDGQVCNAVTMWNRKERYPSECLLSLGREYKQEAVERLRDQYRAQYAVVTLTILAGLVGGFLAHKLFRCLLGRGTRKFGRRGSHDGPPEQSRSNQPAGRHAANSTGRLASIRAGLMGILALCGRSRGYPCLGKHPDFDQVFVSADGELSGVVHGWISACYDKTICVPSCQIKCTTDTKGSMTCGNVCSDVCWTEQHVMRTPLEYVCDVLPRVQACGFSLGGAKRPYSMEAARAGNPLIEKDRLVRISVNGFNVSDESQTDPRVWCLFHIGGVPTFD